MIRGRASDSRSAVARLIGNRRSVGASGAALSVGIFASGLLAAENRSEAGFPAGFEGPGWVAGSWANRRLIRGTTLGMDAAVGRPTPIVTEGTVGEGASSDGWSCRFWLMNRSMAGETDDSESDGAGGATGLVTESIDGVS